MTDVKPETASARAAYLKAQKQRNLFIGLGLVAFVILVFFISMTRMAQGLKHDAALRQAYRSSVAASAAKK
ncbi:MAG: hypothetical protein JF571_07055 [Asticcacaulis sp.]|nr:hypothetical protein [Asticcacaulis sp.]